MHSLSYGAPRQALCELIQGLYYKLGPALKG